MIETATIRTTIGNKQKSRLDGIETSMFNSHPGEVVSKQSNKQKSRLDGIETMSTTNNHAAL
jgi:hypothetical protein